jgi:hypothetical protein
LNQLWSDATESCNCLPGTIGHDNNRQQCPNVTPYNPQTSQRRPNMPNKKNGNISPVSISNAEAKHRAIVYKHHTSINKHSNKRVKVTQNKSSVTTL